MSDGNTIVASRYRIVRELGRGGMGVVYVVEHTRTGDQAALKLLHGQAAKDPQAIERFKREARASGRIKSDHVVKIMDADVAPELDGAPFLVMELLDGSDLEKQVESRGRLPQEEVLKHLGQAARALDKAHAAGIVHRDLKPENLFLHRREDGSTILKILDFGISKVVGGDAAGDIAGAGMTSTGAVMGTPLYMAPEQARGRVSEIGPTTDVWAVGLIAQYLLTGEVYWRANTVAELMVQILSDPLYPPSTRWPSLTPSFDAWFLRSLARDPKERFPSVGQQAEALAAALDGRAPRVTYPDASGTGSATLAAPASAPALPPAVASTGTAMSATASGEPPPVSKSRTPWIVAAAALVLVGAGAAARAGHGHASADTAGVDRASSTPTVPGASATPKAPSAPGSAPSSPPQGIATAPTEPAVAAVAPSVAAPSVAPDPARPSAPPASPKRHGAPPAPSPAPPPLVAKPAVNCTPPYVIDSSGHRQYKPECL